MPLTSHPGPTVIIGALFTRHTPQAGTGIMAVARWKAEYQHRFDPGGGAAPYYWTNVYYYDNSGGDPFYGPDHNAILAANYAGTTDQVALVALRITNAMTGVEYGILTPPDNLGTLTNGERGSLINCVRLSGRAAGREVCYKRWRIPMGNIDVEGDQLSSSCLALFNDTIIPLLALATICNTHGDAVDEWIAQPAVHMWQLRHGTKRRARVVFAYP